MHQLNILVEKNKDRRETESSVAGVLRVIRSLHWIVRYKSLSSEFTDGTSFSTAESSVTTTDMSVQVFHVNTATGAFTKFVLNSVGVFIPAFKSDDIVSKRRQHLFQRQREFT